MAAQARELIFSQAELLEEDLYGDFPKSLLFPALWDELELSKHVPAFAAFCFDAALMCDAEVVQNWMRLAPKDGDPEVRISTIEFYWRRRLKVDLGWKEHGPAWTNRVNRAKQRALKMMREEHVDT